MFEPTRSDPFCDGNRSIILAMRSQKCKILENTRLVQDLRIKPCPYPTISALPTTCLLRGYEHADTQNDRLVDIQAISI